MIKKLQFLVLVLVLIMTGCSTKKIQSKLGADYVADIDSKADGIVIMIPRGSKSILYNFDSGNMKDILYVNIKDNSGYNFDKMVPRLYEKDLKQGRISQKSSGFIFDEDNKLISIRLYYPTLYLADGNIDLTLEYGYKDSNFNIENVKKRLKVYWQPAYMGEDDSGNNELKNDKTFANNHNDSQVNSEYLQEYSKLNKNRISKNKKESLLKIKNEVE